MFGEGTNHRSRQVGGGHLSLLDSQEQSSDPRVSGHEHFDGLLSMGRCQLGPGFHHTLSHGLTFLFAHGANQFQSQRPTGIPLKTLEQNLLQSVILKAASHIHGPSLRRFIHLLRFNVLDDVPQGLGVSPQHP